MSVGTSTSDAPALRFASMRLANPNVTLEPRHANAESSATEVRYGFMRTRFGRCLAAATPSGLCFLEFVDHDDRDALMRLKSLWADGVLSLAPRRLADLGSLLAGGGQDLMPLHLRGTPFQLRVWDALTLVPAGTSISYQGLAIRIGAPRAARAVAGAVAANHVAVFVPCHRVVRTDGGLGGYRWGRTRKLRLLEGERAALPGGQLLGLVA